MPAEQRPTVGRIVHHRNGDTCEAAIIVEVNSASDVTLQVFPPNGATGTVWAGQDQDGRESGTWHWPERV